MKESKHQQLEEAFESEPMPYIAILAPFMNLYLFTKELLTRIANNNDLEPDEYIKEVNDDNNCVMADAHYVINYHRKKKVRKIMDKQIETYAGGIFKESKEFMDKCKETGNEEIAHQLMEIFEKNKGELNADEMFETMKDIKKTLDEDEKLNKQVDEDFRTIWPDTDLKN